MKKRLFRLLAVVLAVLLLAGSTFVVFAAASDPAVIYNGWKHEIEFQNVLPFGSNQEPDLFSNMKNLMPGDSVTQEIKIGAKYLGDDSVKLWLRAENANEDYRKLVETCGQWVNLTVKNGKGEIVGDLASGVELGQFSGRNKSETITVELSIDLEAGNELQGLIAEVDWVFTAEQIPGTIPSAPDGADLKWLTKDHINYIIGYEDNTIKPQNSITRAEVATIFYRLLTDEMREKLFSTESIYADVEEDDWFYVAVCTLTKGNLLEGYPDGLFRPNEPITRAELATIICRFDTKFGELKPSDAFEDVNGHWAEDYVEFAAMRRYVLGYPDKTFRPDQHITRAETVTMVNRALCRGVDEEGLLPGRINWPDNHPGTWYYYQILEAANCHCFERSDRPIDDQTFFSENWTELLPLIDWKTAEEKWILIYTGQ